MQTIDLHDLDPDDVQRGYAERRLERVSDAALVDAAADVLSTPRHDEPDSFVLHAPLELLARAALLPHVSPERRERARQRIVSIPARFETFGPPAEARVEGNGDSGAGSVQLLLDALRAGELEVAAHAGQAVGRAYEASQLTAAVVDELAPSLAAAAHAPIFLHHLPRASPRSALAGAMFGTLAREVARNPDWRLRWMDDAPFQGRGGSLASALAATPVLGPPDSTFIFPLVTQAESSGVAQEVVSGAIGADPDLDASQRSILRVATASMLLDDPGHAAYGWSHCLTIPQGLLSAAHLSDDPRRVVAIAATHVVAFRCGEGSAPLTELAGVAGGIDDTGLLEQVVRPRSDEVQRAIDHAAEHHDAHLVKYVVSCLDAVRADPDGAAQHLRAAIHLSNWWRAEGS